MKRLTLLISLLTLSVATYWGSERGSYSANLYWGKVADERKAKKEVAMEERQKREASELRDLIAKGLDKGSKERWDKYEQCLQLGALKAGQPGANELVVSAYAPTWMQYCLTGDARSSMIIPDPAPESP